MKSQLKVIAPLVTKPMHDFGFGKHSIIINKLPITQEEYRLKSEELARVQKIPFKNAESIVQSKVVEVEAFNKIMDHLSKFFKFNIDLEELKKGELIELYADRVTEILTVLPLLSLSYEPGVSLSDVGIKEDSHHLKILKKAKDSQQENIEKTHETVEELIPYADTDQIVWTILYFEEVIKKMRMGVKGNF